MATTSLVLVFAGVILQTALLGHRWWAAGYLPVTNLFATLFFFSWALALVYLYFELRYRVRATGLFVMLLNLLLLGGALPRDPAVSALIPALDTPLFSLHIIFSFVGYAFFAMAFSIGALFLCQVRLNTALLPDLPTLRKINEEAVFLGFGLFTFCMVAGSIWAHIAWGHSLYFSNPDLLVGHLAVVRPTLFSTVPRVLSGEEATALSPVKVSPPM